MKYLVTGDEEEEDIIVVLPEDDLNLGPVDFPTTTDYHWPNFDVNNTHGTSYEIAQGPFQFGLAVRLDQTKKQVHKIINRFRNELTLNSNFS